MKNKIDINKLIDEKTIPELCKELGMNDVFMDIENKTVLIEGLIFTLEEYESLTFPSAESFKRHMKDKGDQIWGLYMPSAPVFFGIDRTVGPKRLVGVKNKIGKYYGK